MPLFDPKFRGSKRKYIGQTTLTALMMFILLHVPHTSENPAVIASLAASAFIAFGIPHTQAARPRYFLGGYAIAICAAVPCHCAARWVLQAQVPVLQDSATIVFACLAMGASSFLMFLCNFEHPPAAGIALGLVLGGCDIPTVIVIAACVLTLAVAKTIMKPVLIDLL